jgi:Family of unknown function (DUF6166)
MALLPDIDWRAERFYSGFGSQVTVRESADKRSLDVRVDLRNYSTIFGWGSDSLGAAQLSLALLADALGDDRRALQLSQDFKGRVVIDLPARWTMTRSRILAHAQILELQRLQATYNERLSNRDPAVPANVSDEVRPTDSSWH